MSNTFASLRQKRFGDASVLLLALLVFGSVVAFAIYYYMDRRVGSTGPTPIEMQTAQLEQAVRDYPDVIGPRLALGDYYYTGGRFKESAEQYEAALTIDEENILGLWGLGRALVAAGDPEGATVSFQKIIDAAKEADIRGDLVGAAFFFMGKIALDKGNVDEAIELLKNAVAIDRADADSIYLLGAAYVAKGSYDEALPLLSRAVVFVPDFSDAYGQMVIAYTGKGLAVEARYAKGMQLFSQGKLSEAAKELEAVIASKPQYAEAFVGLGLVREKQGQRDAAIRAYSQTLQLQPDNFAARYGLVRLGVVQPTEQDVTHGVPQGGQPGGSQGGSR